ncbi:ParB/RepB/Spo0J family partition protein [Siminovitchia sp. 179-K 8D1 HS]|uniref:ParB/RepB/Spo0J family partition protein n=1 Tax=Siminovitchia sp. 179-K 8D1 HS TaxID=3142385 RepID=UPI00399F4986
MSLYLAKAVTHSFLYSVKFSDFTAVASLISGHQRLRIARDLGLEKVPYQMLDVDEDEAEYLLIADNWERRGKAETDPIKVSRILKFLEEYWKKKGEYVEGRGNAHNRHLKSQSDLAEFIGETRQTTQRLMKLHDLIPQLQRLVSAGKLGTTAGEQLAHLSPEVQTALYEQLGEEIANRQNGGSMSACFKAFFNSRNSLTVISSGFFVVPLLNSCSTSRASGGRVAIS